MNRNVCVLLPAYNEAAKIGFVIRKIFDLKFDGFKISVLVVNDGSHDETAPVAKEAGALVISHLVNRGVGAAFKTGLNWALENDVEFLVHMDSDGQISPGEIPLLFEPVVRDEVDMAIGSRFMNLIPENMGHGKATVLRSLARMVGFLMGYRIFDISCGFRCMNKKVMACLAPAFDYDYIQESLIQVMAARLRIREVPVTVNYSLVASKGMGSKIFRYGCRFIFICSVSIFRAYCTWIRDKIDKT